MEVYAVIDRHREMAVLLKNDVGVSLVLRVRASNDGVSWSIPGNFETYELDTRELPISSVETANTPFTFHEAMSGAAYMKRLFMISPR